MFETEQATCSKMKGLYLEKREIVYDFIWKTGECFKKASHLPSHKNITENCVDACATKNIIQLCLSK